MKIAMAADHGGYQLKDQLRPVVEGLGHQVLDLGTNSGESVDYPDYAEACGNKVISGEADFGIVICGTGIGISIAANKIKGVRCALCTDPVMARLTREHNNANMLAMGARIIGPELAKAIVEAFLAGEFQGARHQRRVDKISAMEQR